MSSNALALRREAMGAKMGRVHGRTHLVNLLLAEDLVGGIAYSEGPWIQLIRSNGRAIE
jgi:hypothetical protein